MLHLLQWHWKMSTYSKLGVNWHSCRIPWRIYLTYPMVDLCLSVLKSHFSWVNYLSFTWKVTWKKTWELLKYWFRFLITSNGILWMELKINNERGQYYHSKSHLTVGLCFASKYALLMIIYLGFYLVLDMESNLTSIKVMRLVLQLNPRNALMII